MNKHIITLMLISMFSICAKASVTDLDVIEAIKSKLKNTQIDYVEETKIKGLFEIQAGQNILYYNLENNLYFFGEIYTPEGKSLTEDSRKMVNFRLLNKYLDQGITIGDPNSLNHVVEFTDPECGYCRQYHQFIDGQKQSIKRTLFFYADNHPKAMPKIEHLICLDDPKKREEDFDKIMKGKSLNLIQCDKAKNVISSHRSIARKFRVTGTPTLFVNNVRVTGGANLDQIGNLLISKEGTNDEKN